MNGKRLNWLRRFRRDGVTFRFGTAINHISKICDSNPPSARNGAASSSSSSRASAITRSPTDGVDTDIDIDTPVVVPNGRALAFPIASASSASRPLAHPNAVDASSKVSSASVVVVVVVDDAYRRPQTPAVDDAHRRDVSVMARIVVGFVGGVVTPNERNANPFQLWRQRQPTTRAKSNLYIKKQVRIQTQGSLSWRDGSPNAASHADDGTDTDGTDGTDTDGLIHARRVASHTTHTTTRTST